MTYSFKTIILSLSIICFCTKAGVRPQKSSEIGSQELQVPNLIFHVVSTDGVFLREKPEISSKKVALIPFGDKVITGEGYAVTAQIDGNFAKWIPVRWAGKVGYVFDHYLKSDRATLLAGRTFSYGLDCTGKTYSEFTWRLFFLENFQYRIEHISEFNLSCTLKHVSNGSYELTGDKLRLKPQKIDNLFIGSKNCPKQTPIDIVKGYDFVDGGEYLVTKCTGKVAFSKDPGNSQGFVEEGH
ncbi:SH3 domain-containing protein [Turneriella parva]|uniref:SH3 type 3 domain protein n=1 Tax=Turneriella parva (strain ATCC BAA-1111 / DSM 21527 / NCTC 11395 / H) TaxID=869212 RepID=I4B9V3_TURPD|nr:SH3 domain-containing protein [Turneriella parva]AFM14060.1 hypothetical protein Turpa_3423 [Turneriella parva DSM 21527]